MPVTVAEGNACGNAGGFQNVSPQPKGRSSWPVGLCVPCLEWVERRSQYTVDKRGGSEIDSGKSGEQPAISFCQSRLSSGP
jgi:hypothetical protein